MRVAPRGARGVVMAAAMLLGAAPGMARQRPQSTSTTFRILPGASLASYAVDEVFLRENNRLFTAVGVTHAVSGEIVLDRTAPGRSRVGEIVVDLQQLTSDDRRRDRALRDEKYLDSDRNPEARLTGAELRGMPPHVSDGAPFRFTLLGQLTVRGISRPTTWQARSTVVGDTLRATATTRVKMSAFGVEVPNLLALRAKDDVLVTLELVAVALPAPVSPASDHRQRRSRQPTLIHLEAS